MKLHTSTSRRRNAGSRRPVAVPLTLSWLVFFAVLPGLASAQESAASSDTAQEAAPSLEEIVVSARRRAESVQDVPLSIVSKSGEYLERAQVQSVIELSRVVPGFIFNEFEAGQQSTAQLRGLSSFAVETHAPQSVGIVVDDVVMSVMGQAVSSFNDIDHIEVLRGPQGTLFGRNTTGGVVHIVTKDPRPDFEAKVSGSYGSYDEVKWNGTINGALSENVSARASVFTSNRGGYIKNIYDGRMMESEEQAGISTKFLYTPHDGTRLKLAFNYIERERLGRADVVLGFGPGSSNEDILRYGSIVGPKNDKTNGVGAHPFSEKVGGASLTWNQDLGDFSLTSISAFEYWKFEFGSNQDFRSFGSPIGPNGTVRFYVPNRLNGWSQEVRINSPSGRRVEYVTGVFASGADLTERRDFKFEITGDPDDPLYLFDLGDQDTKHTDYAFFGEADFHLTDTWTFTAGGRWTHDKTDVSLDAAAPPGVFDPAEGVYVAPDGAYLPFLESEFPGRRKLAVSESEFTWRTGLRWEPTDDRMFYGTVARGFKGPTITALGILGAIKPESAMSYELGSKAEFLNNRLSAAASVFYSKVDDLQAQGSDILQTPRGPVESIFLTNAAKVRSQGVEFELSAAATDNLAFDLGFAYIDAEFVDFTQASCYDGQTPEQGCDTSVEPNVRDLSGQPLTLVPEWSGNAALTYDFTLPFANGKHYARLDYNYQDRIIWDHSPGGVSDAVGILGLTVAFRTADQRMEIQGYVKNLTNEFVVNGLTGGNGTRTADLPPGYQRTWGVAFNYRID